MIKKIKYRRQGIEDYNCNTPSYLLSGESYLVSPNQQVKYSHHKQQKNATSMVSKNNADLNKGNQEFSQTGIRLSSAFEIDKVENSLKYDPNVFYEEEIIPGMVMVVNKHTKAEQIFIKDKRLLVSTPIEPGFIIKAKFTKSAGSITKFIAPEYHLHLINKNLHLISAKNYPLSRQIFKFSTQKSGSYSRKYINQFLATMSCDSVMNKFWLHRPLSNLIQIQEDISINEQQLNMIVKYCQSHKSQDQTSKSNVKNKKMKCYLDYQREDYILMVKRKEDNIHDRNFKVVDFLVLEEQEVQGKIGRVIEKTKSKDSVEIMKNLKKKYGKKDFELVDEEADDYKYLKMQQLNDNEFYIEIQHPLSILQAFAACLTRFEACI